MSTSLCFSLEWVSLLCVRVILGEEEEELVALGLWWLAFCTCQALRVLLQVCRTRYAVTLSSTIRSCLTMPRAISKNAWNVLKSEVCWISDKQLSL